MGEDAASPPLLGVERSITGKAWRRRAYDERAAERIALALDAPLPLGQILAGRGVTPDGAEAFLNPTLRDSFPDPSRFADMDAATARIAAAIGQNEIIGVFADYDVDGGSSAAQLIHYFKALNVQTDLYVPDRAREGYGPTGQSLLAMKDKGCGVVITVDCGAAAHQALSEARAGGLDIVVLDHHLMEGDSPPAAALVNPNRPDDESGHGDLTASGLTLVFLAGLNRELKRRGAQSLEPADLIALTDFAALGTVCDVAPLTGFNRALVTQGLKLMNARLRPSLVALAERASAAPPFTEYHIGFVFGPRINAGGRVGRSDAGARLLCAETPEAAAEFADLLERYNAERKAIEETVLEAAIEQVEAMPDPGAVIVAAGEGWPPGVVGLTAARLVERYGRPAIAIGVDAAGEGRGSGRSVPGVNLGGAIAALKREGLLISGGGHEMAGGLTVAADTIPALRGAISAKLADIALEAARQARLTVDAVIRPAAASEALVTLINQAAPFGPGNPTPVFGFEGLRIAYAERLRGGHVRVSFQDASGARLNGVAFRSADSPLGEALLSGRSDPVHVAARLKRDDWGGRTKIDAHVVDLAWA